MFMERNKYTECYFIRHQSCDNGTRAPCSLPYRGQTLSWSGSMSKHRKQHMSIHTFLDTSFHRYLYSINNFKSYTGIRRFSFPKCEMKKYDLLFFLGEGGYTYFSVCLFVFSLFASAFEERLAVRLLTSEPLLFSPRYFPL